MAVSAGRRSASTFPIVGVGASAGGLVAFQELLAQVPPDSGLAIILVQHLEASRSSRLSDALAEGTTMKVTQAEHGTRVEPNRVYVIPPGAQMAIERGALRLFPLQQGERRPRLPIDHFLRSLAEERGPRAIGVILSGTASDGTAGLAAIRARGGITFAQDPRSARYGEMPRSAVEAGVVDLCLPAPALGAELARLAGHPYLTRSQAARPTLAGAAVLAEVVELVRAATGADFGEYKPATILRRLDRRMAVRKARNTLAYLELLQHDPAEARALAEDLLIKVTSFFRDPEDFEALKSVAFPRILEGKAPAEPIRTWVVGCATGEEVYSLAIAWMEHLVEGPPGRPILIFGSDLSEQAIEVARAGVYPEAAVRGLGAERLGRFFVRTERGWRVSQAVREACVFARHDVARDPPFSRIDLVTCRNVLIYFGQPLQRRVLAAAHYSLGQPGYLLLGQSESAVGVPRLFAAASQASRLFLRRPGPSGYQFAPRAGAVPSASALVAVEGPPPQRGPGALVRQVDALVLARYGPPGVVVDERLEVVQFRGRTGPYLEPPQGAPQRLVLKMARTGLASPLRIALAQARRTGAPVRKDRVAMDRGSAGRTCDLAVFPVSVAGGGAGFAVLFEERPLAPTVQGGSRRRGRTGEPESPSRLELEEALAATREQVAALLDEHSRGDQALASANDGLVSSNEEFQGLNEELETAKEELQATNEELVTLNDELQGRNRELQRASADVLNLLDAVELPILMLDEERRLCRYTRRAAAVLELTAADEGRRLGDLALPIQAPDLEPWIIRSMAEAVLVEAEVLDRSGRWHRLQVRPRFAAGGRVDGAILSLVDIDGLRSELNQARAARDLASGVPETEQGPRPPA